MLDERFGAMALYSIRRLGSLMAPSAEKPVLQHPDCDADRRPPIFLRLPPFRSGAEAPRWRLLRVLFLRRCPLPAPSKTREPAATRCPVFTALVSCLDGSRIAGDDMVVWRGSEAVLSSACWCSRLENCWPWWSPRAGSNLQCRLWCLGH